jgi:hypothetical protein
MKKNEGYEKLLKHVSEIEERNRELEEAEEGKDRDLQEAIQQLHIKEFEILHLTSIKERLEEEVKALQKNLEELQELLRQHNLNAGGVADLLQQSK